MIRRIIHAVVIASIVTTCMFISELLENTYMFLIVFMYLAYRLYEGAGEIKMNRYIQRVLDTEEDSRIIEKESFLQRYLPYIYVFSIITSIQVIWLQSPFTGFWRIVFYLFTFMISAIELYRGFLAKQLNRLFEKALEQSIEEQLNK